MNFNRISIDCRLFCDIVFVIKQNLLYGEYGIYDEPFLSENYDIGIGSLIPKPEGVI